MSRAASSLPLAGVRVVEFAHMVMGPTCGLILADLGAEVVKVEPLVGDETRKMIGSGAGFFAMFNRNKKSLAINIKSGRGREVLLKLATRADIFSENFRGGAMAKLGLDYASLAKLNPRIIYVSHKGFLPGPYEHRTALDEVVQMMGGLAYMTGPEGRPLRAGASVNDIMGGMFGAIGALAALAQREKTGKGQEVQSALFENEVFLVGQHMMQYAVTGKPPSPMPGRISAWAIYDVFSVRNEDQIFLAVVSDKQWEIFCKAFGYADLAADARLATNNHRVRAREWMMPILRERLGTHTAAELSRIFDDHGLPYARITKPHELFDDPHLTATGGLSPMTIPVGASSATQPLDTATPLLPLTLGGERLTLRMPPPRVGEHTHALLADLGYTAGEIVALAKDGIIGDGAAAPAASA